MDDLRGHIFVVENVVQGGALGHEHHEQGHIAPGVCQQQGGGHGAHGGPAHVHAGAHRLPPGEVGPLLHHLVDGGGDVHRQIHHRAGGADEDGGHEDLGEAEILEPGVEQALGVGHDRPVDLEQVGEDHTQHAGDQHPQEGPRNGGGTPPVKAVDQGDDEQGEHQGHRQAHEDGVVPLEVEGHQHLPQHEHRHHEGDDGPHAGAPGKEDEEHREDGGQQNLLVEAVVVGHGDREDLVPLVAHHHHGLVAGGEDLVLLQGAVEHVDAGGGLALEAAAQQLQGAGLLVLEGPLEAGGDGHQDDDQQQAQGQRGVIPALGRVAEKGSHRV